MSEPKVKDAFDALLSKTTRKTHSSLNSFIKTITSQLDQEDSFYTLDLADIVYKAQLWKETYPDVEAFYAIKANRDPVLLRLLVLLGFGFDCSNMGEMRLALDAGAAPAQIIFAHTVKTPSALRFASSVGVDLLTVDSVEELHKIAQHFPRARLVVRMKPDCDHSNLYDLKKKFGCDVGEAQRLLIVAKDLGLQVVGTSFHAGALCDNPRAFIDTILDCRTVFELGRQIGLKLTILDIGAGFHGTHDKEAFFREVGREVVQCVRENFPEDVRVVGEPGTFVVGSAATLATAVIGKRAMPQHGEDDIEMSYYLNNGRYGSFFLDWQIYGSYPELLLEACELSGRARLQSKLWGQTCCSEDVIAERCLLPEMQAGEWLLWRNMGAYTNEMCSTFQQVPLPLTRRLFVRNHRLRLDWISNMDEVLNFIAENADLVEKESSSSVANGH